MKKICALALATCVVLGSYAQTDQQTTEQIDPPTWSMIDDSLGHVLNLTNDQMKQVQLADETYRTNRKAGDKNAMEKRDKDLRSILLPSQFTEWQEIARKRRQ